MGHIDQSRKGLGGVVLLGRLLLLFLVFVVVLVLSIETIIVVVFGRRWMKRHMSGRSTRINQISYGTIRMQK